MNIEVIPTYNQSFLSKADIISTATTSKQAVFDERFLKDDVFIGAIGAYKPEMCEIPSSAFKNSLVVVDSKQSCLEEAGDIINAINAGIISENDLIEIGKLIPSSKERKKGKKTIFKSVGNAVQDLKAAEYFYKKALEKKVEKYIEL